MTDSDRPRVSGKPSPLIVRLLLFAALALLVAAAGYEYLFARAQSGEALTRLQQLDQKKTDIAEPLYDEEVRELIGFEPERKTIDHLTVVDYYRWQSAIPTKQYYVWVLYRLTYDNRWQCDAYGANTEPEAPQHAPNLPDGAPTPAPPPGVPKSLPDDSTPPTGPQPPKQDS
ncbi:MAG: hypothetical protein RIC55_35470 [Pirellulaceae bacterium]